MDKHLKRLMRDVDRSLSDYIKSYNLPPDYEFCAPHPVPNPSIDDLVCPVCDGFTSSAGCDIHPLQKPLL